MEEMMWNKFHFQSPEKSPLAGALEHIVTAPLQATQLTTTGHTACSF